MAKNQGGRLLGEFLVGLGLLFLALTADVAILHSAAKASTQAFSENEALALAQDSMEAVIADPSGVRNEQVFELNGTSYHQRIWLYPDKERDGLSGAVVELKWEAGGQERQVRLERYVRSR